MMNPDDLVVAKAKLKLSFTEEGGRTAGIVSGYRPNHVFENTDDQMITYIGEIVFEWPSTIEPGEEVLVTVRFLKSPGIDMYLYAGRRWWINEGARNVGEAEIISIEA